MGKLNILLMFVTQLLTLSWAFVRQSHFTVHAGLMVSTVYEITDTDTLIGCSTLCHTQNDVTQSTCSAATFDTSSGLCHLSSLASTYSTNNFTLKTMVLSQACGPPPTIENGVLNVTSETAAGSTATLQCDGGFVGSVTTVQCAVGTGWNTVGVLCTLPPPASYYGTSFVTGFLKNGNANTGSPMLLFACPQSTAEVTVSIPSLGITNEKHTLVGGTLALTYDNAISVITSGATEDKSVYVTADRPITLYAGSIKTSGSSDGSLVLPETSLGTDYVTAGHTSSSSGTDEFLVIGTQDTTSVTLTVGGAAETITLNRHQTYYRASGDLTGTRIQASAPVYVVAGHVCANIPDDTVLYCDYIDETMISKTSLGTVHVISFMKPRPDYTISIVAPQTSTSVTIYDKAGNILESVSPNTMTSPQFRSFTGSQTISVVSSQPVMVSQYGHGSNLAGGDPSMMAIPDTGHFGHQYDFVVPPNFNNPSTLAVVISTAFPSSGLLLNGLPFTPTEIVSVAVPGNGNYEVLYGDVSVGYNRLTHTSGNSVSFGAWIYGCTTNHEYAWVLGYK